MINTVFSAVPVGIVFDVNGNTWKKKSSRTASMVKGPVVGQWFYFRQPEHVVAHCDNSGKPDDE